MIKVDLVIIDPQIDFCDPSNGSMYVKGAEKDIDRITNLVNRLNDKLNDIHVTMDSHRYVDIAHPIFWKNSSGKHPDPFTIITAKDIKEGNWTPTILKNNMLKKVTDYVKTLEDNGRYPLCIWPPHCLYGSQGWTVMPQLFNALVEWEKNLAQVDFVMKGMNPYTEHYSAVQADVPDPNDPSTQINTNFVQTLMEADEILLCGEAGSHCLANTVKDVGKAFGDDSYIKKMILLEDGTSPVPGFENYQEDFIKEMTAKGMKITTTQEYLK